MISEWTKTEEAKLKKLWAIQGKSARQIAEILKRTRNAIIGKAHRMNLPKRNPSNREPAVKATTPTGKNGATGKSRGIVDAARKARQQHINPPPLPTHPITGPAWDALPGTTPYSLEHLPRDACKWPIGNNRPYAFCGANAPAKSSYCPTHKLRAENLPKPAKSV